MTYDVAPVTVHDPGVAEAVAALTAELATGGYTADQTFGYPLEQLAEGVHLVGARVGCALVGLGGVELQEDSAAELKRFWVRPDHRGTGVAAAVLDALVAYAGAHGVTRLRLETGDRQHAALRFYARHGFRPVERFGPYVDSATSVCLERSI